MRNFKIIVPIQGKNRAEIEEKVSKIPFDQINAIEWRADGFANLKEALKNSEEISDFGFGEVPRKVRVLFTYRTLSETDDHNYAEEVTDLAGDFFDRVDVELCNPNASRLAESLNKRHARVVTSYHNFNTIPSIEELDEIYENLAALNGYVIKIAVFATDEESAKKFQVWARAKKIDHPDHRHIFIVMGEFGKEYRINPTLLGSVATFAHNGEKSAPGQVSVDEVLGNV